MRTPIMMSLALAAGTLSAPPAAATTERSISAAQVLEAVENAHEEVRARELLETYVRAAIEGAEAAGDLSGERVICSEPGQGRFDAGDFAAHLRKEVPQAAQRATTPATPLLIAYLSARYPC